VLEVSGDQGPAVIGEQRDVRAVVGLGKLSLADVSVELLHGPVRADGTLTGVKVEPLQPAEAGDGGQAFSGSFLCTSSGEYGFAVRVVPAHDDLLSWTDTGLVAWAGEDVPGDASDGG
jgi:starch phosphorylase